MLCCCCGSVAARTQTLSKTHSARCFVAWLAIILVGSVLTQFLFQLVVTAERMEAIHWSAHLNTPARRWKGEGQLNNLTDRPQSYKTGPHWRTGPTGATPAPANRQRRQQWQPIEGGAATDSSPAGLETASERPENEARGGGSYRVGQWGGDHR